LALVLQCLGNPAECFVGGIRGKATIDIPVLTLTEGYLSRLRTEPDQHNGYPWSKTLTSDGADVLVPEGKADKHGGGRFIRGRAKVRVKFGERWFLWRSFEAGIDYRVALVR